MYTFKIGTLICVISFKCVISVFILCTFQATILCDIVVLYVVKKRDVYKSMKYQSVADESVNVSSAFFFFSFMSEQSYYFILLIISYRQIISACSIMTLIKPCMYKVKFTI